MATSSRPLASRRRREGAKVAPSPLDVMQCALFSVFSNPDARATQSYNKQLARRQEAF